MNKYRKNMLKRLLVASLLMAALCTACGKPPRESASDRDNEAVLAEYLAPLQEEATALFSDIAEAAVGSKPEEVRIEFRNADTETLKESKGLSELLTDASPALLVGCISSSDKGYSDEEIHEIILETKKREITVDLYFNYNSDYIYQVRNDGVMIDKATGKDGGAMREQIEYDLGESEE